MPKQTYALEPGGPKRLEISWKAFWKDTIIQLDGGPVGAIPDKKSLEAGQAFRLPDGSTLKVQLIQKFSTVELRVLRNDQPLPGSASDPQTMLKVAYGIVFFVAGLNILLGLVAVFFNVQLLVQIGIGLGSLLFGLAFLLLGFFIRRRSLVALILAILIFALDGIIGFLLAASQGNTSLAGIFFRIILLIPMFQGIGAIQALRKQGE